MRSLSLALPATLLLCLGCAKKADESPPVSEAQPAAKTAEAPVAQAPAAEPEPTKELPKAADVELVKGETESFGFGCPTGWELKEPGGKQKSLNCSSTGSMCFALEEFGTGELTPKEYWKKAEAAQARAMGPVEVTQEGAYEVEGVPFYRVLSKGVIFFAFTDKGRAVTLSCVPMSGDLSSGLPFYDAMAQSFRWK